jgi:phage anti-repressor protein
MQLDILKYEFSVNGNVDGVSAKDLYRELDLDKSHFSRWCNREIVENGFFVENQDWMRLAIQGETPTGGKVERTDYVISTDMAKRLAMKSESSKAEEVRTYFIECEKKLKQQTSPTQQPQILLPSTQAATVISDVMQVAALFNVPTHLAQIESVNMAKKSTGFDYAPLLALSPMQDNIRVEEMMLEVTPLSEKLGVGTGKAGGAKLNKILAALELQVKEGKTWVATASATGKFSIHSANENSWSGYNMKWNVSFVTKLLKEKGYI